MSYERPFGPMRLVHTSNSPRESLIRPDHFVDRLTGRNWKERGICRVTRDGPIYIYVCAATPRYQDRHRTCYAVRVYHDERVGDWKRFAADFGTLDEALNYANCRTPSPLAWCSQPVPVWQYDVISQVLCSPGKRSSPFRGMLRAEEQKQREAQARARPWLANIIKELSQIAALLKQEEEAEERRYLRDKSDV